MGIVVIEAAYQHHGLAAGGEGRWIEVVLWTDDTDAAIKRLTAASPTAEEQEHGGRDSMNRTLGKLLSSTSQLPMQYVPDIEHLIGRCVPQHVSAKRSFTAFPACHFLDIGGSMVQSPSPCP